MDYFERIATELNPPAEPPLIPFVRQPAVASGRDDSSFQTVIDAPERVEAPMSRASTSPASGVASGLTSAERASVERIRPLPAERDSPDVDAQPRDAAREPTAQDVAIPEPQGRTIQEEHGFPPSQETRRGSPAMNRKADAPLGRGGDVTESKEPLSPRLKVPMPQPAPIRVRVVGSGRLSEEPESRPADAMDHPARQETIPGEAPVPQKKSRRESKAGRPVEPPRPRVEPPARQTRAESEDKSSVAYITPDKPLETPVARADPPGERDIVIENLTVELTRNPPHAPRRRARARHRPLPTTRAHAGTMLRFGMGQV